MKNVLLETCLMALLLCLVSCESTSKSKVENCTMNGVKVDCASMNPEKKSDETVNAQTSYSEILEIKGKVKYQAKDGVITFLSSVNLTKNATKSDSYCQLHIEKGMNINFEVSDKELVLEKVSKDQTERHTLLRSDLTSVQDENLLVGKFEEVSEQENDTMNFNFSESEVEVTLYCKMP